MREWFYGSGLYSLTLGGRAPESLYRIPPAEPWPGSADAVSALLSGTFLYGGHAIPLGDAPWGAVSGTPEVAAGLHGFDWLSELRHHGSEAARREAHALVADWIQRHRRWHPLVWRADVLGARLANWLSAHAFLTQEIPADHGFERALLRAEAAQFRHLRRVVASAPRDGRAFFALKGLIYGILSLPGNEDALAPALASLEAETERQILPDGGHLERNPARHVEVLRHLLDIRNYLLAVRMELPKGLLGAIDRMVPMVGTFRLGDGRLALFNGGREGDRTLIDAVLGEAGISAKPLLGARHCGFQRLAAGKTVVVVDTGEPPPKGADSRAHAGTLAFEMSIGAHRLVVNCGAHLTGGGAWTSATRATAAHSTVTVDDRNSSEVGAKGLGPRLARPTAIRQEIDGGTWLETGHDGYRASLGLVHHRAILLDVRGNALIGEDFLESPDRAGNVEGKSFAVRFHLHPDVHALRQEGGGVLLKLADGKGWRFEAAGGAVHTEESIYLGENHLRRTEQIVVGGILAETGARVRWRFSKVGD